MCRKIMAFLTTIAVMFSSFGMTSATVKAASEFDIQNGVLVKYNGAGDAVTIPSGVTRIGDSAFEGSSVTSVDIPYGVTDIGNRAFANCYYDLTNVSLPSSLLSIGDGAFMRCRGISYINLPYGLQRIGTDAFFESGLTSVSIPNSVTSWGRGRFWLAITYKASLFRAALPKYREIRLPIAKR